MATERRPTCRLTRCGPLLSNASIALICSVSSGFLQSGGLPQSNEVDLYLSRLQIVDDLASIIIVRCRFDLISSSYLSELYNGIGS